MIKKWQTSDRRLHDTHVLDPGIRYSTLKYGHGVAAPYNNTPAVLKSYPGYQPTSPPIHLALRPFPDT